MQPINYGVEIQDPTQSFLSALQAGAAIQDTMLKQEQQQQQMVNQKLAQEGFAKLRQPGATAADYANLAMVLPEAQAKSVRESFSMLSDDRQQNALQQSGQVFAAFKAGRPEIAIGIIDRQIEAKRNSGDNEGAMFLETWRDVAKVNPKATEDYFGFTISQIPGGEKVIESAVKLGDERRAEAIAPLDLKKRAAELGLTNAQTGQALAQTRKLGIETQKSALELEASKATGGLDPEKTFVQEEKIRKEWQGRKKVYNELDGTFSNIKSSADAKTGPGDIALITGFMKMLDPSSVVRETEFATARDTAGLYDKLLNTSQKMQSGQIFALDSKQRQEYVNLAKQYLDSAQKKAGDEKKALNVVVKNYKLNPGNVFGEETETVITPPASKGSVNPPTAGQRTVTVDY